MPGTQEPKSPPPAAFDVLRAYLEARAWFGGREFEIIGSAFLHRRLEAGDFLQRGGDITQYAAFVATGCLRNYVIDAKGKEHIVQFCCDRTAAACLDVQTEGANARSIAPA